MTLQINDAPLPSTLQILKMQAEAEPDPALKAEKQAAFEAALQKAQPTNEELEANDQHLVEANDHLRQSDDHLNRFIELVNDARVRNAIHLIGEAQAKVDSVLFEPAEKMAMPLSSTLQILKMQAEAESDPALKAEKQAAFEAALRKADNDQTLTVTVKATPDLIETVKRFLAIAEWLGSIGHSCAVVIGVDGDGSDRLKVTDGFDTKDYLKDLPDKLSSAEYIRVDEKEAKPTKKPTPASNTPVNPPAIEDKVPLTRRSRRWWQWTASPRCWPLDGS